MDRCLSAVFAAVLAGALVAAPIESAAQAPNPCASESERCITVSFRDAEIRDVISSFAEFSGLSIVLGQGVSGAVTAEIRNQPWDIALRTILQAYGLEARETGPGLLRVDSAERLRVREVMEPLVTQVFRINYVPVQELVASLSPLTSERGSISANPSTNTLIVTDVASHVDRIGALLGRGG